jgi:tetratricopeptide (TPR) repeat protein
MGLAQNGFPGAAGPAASKPTWTQRIMAPFGGGAAGAAAAQRDAAVAAAKAADEQRMRLDPLALSNGASSPTPELLVSMAELSCHGGSVDHGRQLYQRALTADPKNLEALLGAARMEDREGRLEVAVMLYQRAATAYPNNPTVLNDLALCLARQGQLPAAERALARAVQLEPTKVLYRNNMAKVQVELNHMDAACQNLAAVYPAPVVNYNMGVLLHQRGRVAEAERFLTAATTIDPRMEPAQALLAQIRAASPVYQTARAAQPATTVVPTSTSAAPASVAASPESQNASATPRPTLTASGAEPALLPPIN